MTATRLPGPAPQCRSGEYSGDARAQQRRGGVQRDRVGDAQHVVLVDDDRAAVAALGRLTVAADAVVGADHAAVVAVLLLTGLAVLAFAAGVDEAADADAVADLVLGDLGADLGDDARRSRGRAPPGSSAWPHSP